MSIERCCNSRRGKCSNDTRSFVDSEYDHSVFERCNVGAHNIHHINDSNMAGPVQHVGGDISLHVLASCLHDHADEGEKQHEREPFYTSPNIDSLSSSEGYAPSQSSRHNTPNGKQSMLVES